MIAKVNVAIFPNRQQRSVGTSCYVQPVQTTFHVSPFLCRSFYKSFCSASLSRTTMTILVAILAMVFRCHVLRCSSRTKHPLDGCFVETREVEVGRFQFAQLDG